MDEILSIQVIPNARETKLIGWREDVLCIRLACAPIEGKANKALVRFLSKTFDVAPSLIVIEKGLSSRKKRVRLPGWVAERMRERPTI